MNQQTLIFFVIAWTIVGAFIFTVFITCFSLIGWISFKDPEQQKKLFAVLIIEIIVICLGIFKGYFDSQKLNIFDSKTKAESYVQETKKLSSISPDTLLLSLNPSVGGTIWGEFYRYRTLIRLHMRRLCFKNNIKIDDDESFQSMAETLQTKGVIDKNISENIKRIGYATYTAQWGTGNQPMPNEALFVADSSEIIIKRLEKIN